uniref:Uncharacterized protein n=1 Tax=Hyaloperonospora arabidopsidis (strain Emoy2) TaxID=559515 RepID=M4BM05_HYAAE
MFVKGSCDSQDIIAGCFWNQHIVYSLPLCPCVLPSFFIVMLKAHDSRRKNLLELRLSQPQCRLCCIKLKEEEETL